MRVHPRFIIQQHASSRDRFFGRLLDSQHTGMIIANNIIVVQDQVVIVSMRTNISVLAVRIMPKAIILRAHLRVDRHHVVRVPVPGLEHVHQGTAVGVDGPRDEV